MTHRKDVFQDFTSNVDGVVYFVDQSKIKPSGLGTIRLKLPGLPEFLLHHVLYLPQLKRNLLSLVHIRQQGHSIHMFDGKLEVRKTSDHSLVMRGIEEERLLKLQGTFSHAQHFSYNSHHEEGTLPSSLLWHARFGHLNYDNLYLLKKNGVVGLPTIPRKLKQCDACILGKHNKQSFHDSHSRGIPILDQHVEYSSEEHSPPHETLAMDDALSDVIDSIGRLNLDSVPTQSTEQLGPSGKGPPKWLTKTLESVNPDEVGKTGTKNSNWQNGDFERTSFKEVASHDEWKEAMQKEYDALINNGTWKLVDPPLGTKPIGCKWVYKNKYKADGSFDKHKARLVAKGFA
eukprot:PITA_09496